MTHKQRVLQLLSDGEPHSHREGYALGVMLHSRVSDLRKDGHEIECYRDGDLSMYRLTALAETDSDGAGSVSASAAPVDPIIAASGGDAEQGGALVLFDVPPARELWAA